MLYQVSSHDCLTYKNQIKSETVFCSDQKQDKVTLPFTSFKAIPLPSPRHNNPNGDMLND